MYSAGLNQGREYFINILSQKEHTNKWVSFATSKIRIHRNRDHALYKQAEDYVQDAILKILSLKNIPERDPEEIDKYVCGFIRKEISYVLRNARAIVPISKWDDEDEMNDDDLIENNLIPNNMVEEFDDPFKVTAETIGTDEKIRICYELLEKKPSEWLIVFDERAKGHPNRDIAKYLSVDVEEVEKKWKRIVRYLRKNISTRGNIYFISEERFMRKMA